MKVVIEIAAGRPRYRSDPPFEKGFGIKNAVAMFGGKPQDYEEIEMTFEQYNANPAIVAAREAAEREAAIAAEIVRHQRAGAIERLGLTPEAE